MSYTDIAYADTINTSTEWVGSSDPEKQVAIDTGEIWINSKYTCAVTDPVNDNLQKANALLADMYIQGTMFSVVEGNIISTKVKADTVESEKTYSEGTQQGSNPFAEIDLLLGSVCTIGGYTSGGILATRRV